MGAGPKAQGIGARVYSDPRAWAPAPSLGKKALLEHLGPVGPRGAYDLTGVDRGGPGKGKKKGKISLFFPSFFPFGSKIVNF